MGGAIIGALATIEFGGVGALPGAAIGCCLIPCCCAAKDKYKASRDINMQTPQGVTISKTDDLITTENSSLLKK